MAARADLDYHLCVIGPYPGPDTDLQRSYIGRQLHLGRRRRYPEVWIVKSWNHPLINAAAACSRMRGIPLIMFGERPGYTYTAETVGSAVRILLRKILLPVLFLPYRYPTLLLGTGERAVTEFRALSGQWQGQVFVYPNSTADGLLELPPKAGIGSDPLLLYVGSFIRRKAIDLMISACETAWNSGAHFRARVRGIRPNAGRVGGTS